jgi:hypothetical protein
MDAQKHIYSIVTMAVSTLRADPEFAPRLLNKWLPAETWVAALKKAHLIDLSFRIDAAIFNRAMSSSKSSWREAMLRFDGSNTTGVFRVTYKNRQFYFVTERKEQASYPCHLDARWKESVDAIADEALTRPVTRSRPAEVHRDDDANEANKRQKSEVPAHVSPPAGALFQTTY